MIRKPCMQNEMDAVARLRARSHYNSNDHHQREGEGMSDGDYTKEEARALQGEFTGRLKCEEADRYGGKEAPTCLPICEACLLKWIAEEISPECKSASVSPHFTPSEEITRRKA